MRRTGHRGRLMRRSSSNTFKSYIVVPSLLLLLSQVGMGFDNGRFRRPPPNSPFPNQTAPDQSMMRISEAPTLSPTDNPMYAMILSDINSFYKDYPYFSSFITVGVKAALADGVAQANEGNLRFHWLRSLVFFLYGGFYQGMAQYYIYNHIFPILFGDSTTWTTVLKEVCFDCLVVTPSICLPLAYIMKAIVYQYGFYEACQRYYIDITCNSLLYYYWSIWAPVQCLTFSVVPKHLRIIFIAAVSFFWVIILSSVSAKGDADRDMALCRKEYQQSQMNTNSTHSEESQDVFIFQQEQEFKDSQGHKEASL